jgi:hypothetical protein
MEAARRCTFTEASQHAEEEDGHIPERREQGEEAVRCSALIYTDGSEFQTILQVEKHCFTLPS